MTLTVRKWPFALKPQRLVANDHHYPPCPGRLSPSSIANLLAAVCTGAATAIMNPALKIIRREGSDRLASACAKARLIDPNRKSQAPYTLYRKSGQHTDAEIVRSEQYMLEHFGQALVIDEVAECVHLSPRHFKNATGLSPRAYQEKFLDTAD